MHDAVAVLQDALDAVKPHLDELAEIGAKITDAESTLATLDAQIKLRQQTLADIQATIESEKARGLKIQRDEIEARQITLRGLVSDIDAARAELTKLQTDTHEAHTKHQDLLRKAGKLEASLG